MKMEKWNLWPTMQVDYHKSNIRPNIYIKDQKGQNG